MLNYFLIILLILFFWSLVKMRKAWTPRLSICNSLCNIGKG